MVWQLSGVWLCKRIWVCTLCGAPQVGPNSSQTSYLLHNLYCDTCYWHSGLLSVEFFQFEVFVVVCVGPKWCYNIPISVGLKLWMHVLWMMDGECTFKFLLMNPSDWLALAVMVLICLSHFKLFWMVMPKYFAESTFSSVCPCNWYVYEIVFRFCVTLRDRPFNLQGGGGGGGAWYFVSLRIFFSDNTRVRIFFFVAQCAKYFSRI